VRTLRETKETFGDTFAIFQLFVCKTQLPAHKLLPLSYFCQPWWGDNRPNGAAARRGAGPNGIFLYFCIYNVMFCGYTLYRLWGRRHAWVALPGHASESFT
jgi:hypothetical protein